MTDKIFKPITNYELIYEISNDGYVKNLKTNKITNGWQHDKLGYRKVRLYKNKKYKDFYLHRLVAIEFVSNIENKNFVNHIDHNPKNNNYKNLEWCTHAENMNHAKINNRFNKIGTCLIHKETKKIFNSIKEASNFINIKPNTLVYQLRRKSKCKFEAIKSNS
jgi:hypothetical protein